MITRIASTTCLTALFLIAPAALAPVALMVGPMIMLGIAAACFTGAVFVR